ncbi:MAG TPA: choice-of-anchor D domain-containing protein, partial [Vicinamibacterales bacterium]|nr:choice-of-anchor D domain-containing protein [Vicinamibacterales bacterium]
MFQDGETTFIAGGSVPVQPFFAATLTLTRSGNIVSASYCMNQMLLGPTCFALGSVEFAAGEALAGVAVTSHDPSTVNQALFLAPTLASVPLPWGGMDVGVVGLPGHATYENATGTFFVSGAGSDIWGPIDSFYAVSRTFVGDSVLTARVVSEQDTHPFAKAGLIMGDVAANARRVILDVKPDGGIEFMARTDDGTSMSFVAGASASFPVWLRLSENGAQFTGEMSADGETWTTIGTVTMTNPTTIVTGFAVTSHDPSLLNAAVFDNVGFSMAGVSGTNLLVNGGFEDSVVPNVGPGWVSDRQSPAVSETADPHSGNQNGACRTTSLECGIYQEITAPGSDTLSYWFSLDAHADHPGGLVGVNVNGTPTLSFPVQVGGYQNYSGMVFARAGDVIRVWMYAPGTPGFVVIDDVGLTVLVASLSTNPTSVGFGNQMVNTTSVPSAVILTNTGSTLQPVSARMNGVNFADFTQTNDCSSSLAVGASCTFNISFTPSATGARFGILVVDGFLEEEGLVNLTGTGTN